MIDQEIFDWILLLARWLHITVAVTWIGTSIFFMWLDRTLIINNESKKEGHAGELWMVHGGGFYHVEKLLMGPTKVPKVLHWFKWESYWTWLSGTFLVVMIFYTGNGAFLLDDTISNITYGQGVLIGIFSIAGSWFFYDFLWERKLTKDYPMIGHLLTIIWFVLMTYFLCHTLSGRAAYLHIGAMLGTWMTANVFMRIIPRQLKMVEASKNGEAVNQDWGKNAKNRSTHNTYFTLPIIFIMLSNHFPTTYGHDYNWLILLFLTGAGACIREYFVKREISFTRSKIFALAGVLLIVITISLTKEGNSDSIQNASTSITGSNLTTSKNVLTKTTQIKQKSNAEFVNEVKLINTIISKKVYYLKGVISFKGIIPLGKKLRLPRSCAKQFKGDVYSDEIKVSNGKLQNVLVRIVKGIDPIDYTDIPNEVVRIDQKGCMYSPRVSAARVGQKVMFINSDPVFHNVKSITKFNKKFNFALPKIHQTMIKIFYKPEIFLKTKCSVHPWMGSYIAIMNHPFFNISNSSGEFKITNLPKGNYTIEFWHEKLGTQKKNIFLNKDLDNLDITFEVKRND